MAILHTIRDPKGKTGKETIQVKLSPLLAIVENCKMCLGYEGDPKDCTSPLCACFPFRTGDAHSGKVVTDAMRERGRTLAAKRALSASSKKG